MAKEKDSELDEIERSGGFEWTPGSPWPPYVGVGNTANVEEEIEHSSAWYDYTRNDPSAVNPFTDAFDYLMAESVTGKTPWIYESPDNGKTIYRYERGTDPLKRELYVPEDDSPSDFTTLSDNDDQIAHHISGPADEDLFASMDSVDEYSNYDELNLNIQANSPYNDGWTQDFYKEELTKMTDSRNKYHEKEILKDIEEYVSGTYNGHYTGTKHEYRNVQTIDLMASRDLASAFCQSNILKYGSRYGSKDGRNKKDLLKVIHYAMLLLHFDEHYGKPKMTSGNIDHNMP